jgi:hypothetical protein
MMVYMIVALSEERVVESEVTRANLRQPNEVDMRVQALRKAGKHREAIELLKSYYNIQLIDNEQVKRQAEEKGKSYKLNSHQPTSPKDHSSEINWLGFEGTLAGTTAHEKLHDVVKDPLTDTLFAVVIRGNDTLVLYKGVVNFATASISWSEWIKVSTTLPVTDPSITLGSTLAGNKYVVVAFSQYFGTDFDPRILKINRNTGAMYVYTISGSTDDERAPFVTSDYESYADSYIYLVYWNDNKDSLMFSRIFDLDATTFEAPRGIAYSVGTFVTTGIQRPSIDYFYNSASSADKLFAVYRSNDTLKLADGSPFGDSWNPVAATFPKSRYIPYIKGRVGGPHVAIVYSYYFGPDLDCVLQYSTDGGATFTSYNCGATGLDELWPTVAFSADTVWVSYLHGYQFYSIDSITDTMRVYVTKHSLNGSSWIRKDSINDPAVAHGTYTAWHPIIVGPEKNGPNQFLHVSWSRRFAGTLDFDIKFNYHFFTATSYEEKVNKDFVYVVKNGIYIKGNGDFTIYNIEGKKVLTGNVKGEKFIQIPKGLYIVRFNNINKSIVVR